MTQHSHIPVVVGLRDGVPLTVQARILSASTRQCAICGSIKTVDDREPLICQFMCYWTLEGWLGWNARTNKVAVRNQQALYFVPTSKTDKVAKISYPKMIALARMMGWTGRESAVGTFPAPVKPLVMRKAAGR